MSAQASSAPRPRPPRAIALRFPALNADWTFAALLAVALAWIAITANGGLRVSSTTTVEIVVDLAAGVIAAIALLTLSAWRRDVAGTAAAALFALLVVLTAASTIWSVTPDLSWIEANRLVTYLAAFGVGFALVRLAPQRWTGLLAGITLAAVAVSAWALMHKVFPAWLEPDEVFARLREPFGYWNAVGVMAALGVPGCLWLGTRRAGHPVVAALAYPATGLLFIVLMLSYSRGALLAMVLGCIFWFAANPLRLRGFAVLLTGVLGGALVIAWAFSQVALTEDRVPRDLREQAGHQLGIAVAFMLALLLVAGLAIGFFRDRTPLTGAARRRAGIAALVVVALLPAGGAVALATSEDGLGGSISTAFDELTDTNFTGVTNEPGRLTAVGSVRARYWSDAWTIFEERPWLGAGAGSYRVSRLRIRDDTLDVLHAHGFVPQTLADRGIAGMALALAALVALLFAISGAVRRRDPAERTGLLTLTAMIVVFGIHSFVDWTWFVPGIAIPMLLAGGWLAGRGRDDRPVPPGGSWRDRLRAGATSRVRLAAAFGALVLAMSAAWAAWQPQRSIDATDRALDALGADPPQIPLARELARDAQQHNPLAVEPFLAQASIERKAGNEKGALQALEAAVRLQPANPVTWTALAEFQLHVLEQPARTRKTLSAALYLDPRSAEAIQLLLESNRTATATS